MFKETKIPPLQRDTETASPEEKARKKIREFVSDPNLKMHFTLLHDLDTILKDGLLSEELAKRAKRPFGTNVSNEDVKTDPRSISVADKLKGDWWFHQFYHESKGGRRYVGILLSNDLPLRDKSPTHPAGGESLAPFRIKPNKFDGLVIYDDEFSELEQRISRLSPNYIPLFHEIEPPKSPILDYLDILSLSKADLLDEDPIIIEIKKEKKQLQRKNKKKKTYLHPREWSLDDQNRLKNLRKKENRRTEEIVFPIIEQMVGKPLKELRVSDLFSYRARQAGLPLYRVDPKFTTQKLLWPESN